MEVLNTRIKHKRDTEENWNSADPVLLNGEVIIVDIKNGDKRTKTGDGKKRYSELPFDKDGIPEGGVTGQALIKTDDGETWDNIDTISEKESQKPISFQINGLEGESFTVEFTEDGEGGNLVTSFNGRTGAVTPQAGDYTAEMVGAISHTEKGRANGIASLDDNGKVIADQLPEMNYDSAGSAQAVQQALNTHAANKTLHVTAAERKAWNSKAPGTHTHTAAQVGALPISGGTMTGAINMNGKALTNLPTPKNNKDAAPKDYVDAALANVSKVQFVFGTYSGNGQESNSINLGFSPLFVFVYKCGGSSWVPDTIHLGFCARSNPLVDFYSKVFNALEITSSGFKTSGVFNHYALNKDGTYAYIAIKEML